MKFTLATLYFFMMFLLQAHQSVQNDQTTQWGAVQTKTPKSQPTSCSNIGKRSAEEMVAAGFKRYGIEKGTLSFRIEGAVSGTENIYFDHWGWREGKYLQTEAKVGTYNKKQHKVQFLDGERRYEYNPTSGKAHFFESHQIQKSADRYQTKDMTIVGDEMIKNMGGVSAGISKIQGVICEVWNISPYKTEISMWKGITMGELSKPASVEVKRTCVSLDTVSAVPLEKIVLPRQAELIEAN